MTESKGTKRFDLEDRSFRWARAGIEMTNSLPKTLANIEIIKQVVRSSGSVGANYIEANEALSKKDFAVRVKICRKEAKETQYWLRLLDVKREDMIKTHQSLIGEATELMKIFGSIVEKVK
jgi:four helix bundle protein